MNCAHGIEIQGRLQSAGVEVVMCGNCAKILRVPRRLNRRPNRTRGARRTDFGRPRRFDGDKYPYWESLW